MTANVTSARSSSDLKGSSSSLSLSPPELPVQESEVGVENSREASKDDPDHTDLPQGRQLGLVSAVVSKKETVCRTRGTVAALISFHGLSNSLPFLLVSNGQ